MYRELMIGCGARRTKDLRLPTAEEIRARVPYGLDRRGTDFLNLVTLDNNEDHKPDWKCDLKNTPFHIDHVCGDGKRYNDLDDLRSFDWIILANAFDEIHAYEVLEHIGQQGDAELFFAQFSEFHRILKPNGLFFATCPAWCSPWAWGDPSHTRVITSGTLVFLSQKEYEKQVGKTPMSDFRYLYKADFEPVFVHEDNDSLLFVLRAIK